jgi:hypothetical protein
MSGCLLDEHEKRRFSEWLELEISSTQAIILQLEKMKVPAELLKREQIRAAACAVVLRYINAGESMTVEAKP